jgi:putative acetyltransferase
MEQERHNIPNIYLPNTETWVAEADSDVVGFISLIKNEVAAIFVDPEFQGQGIGLALMNKAKELRGDLEVEVFKENPIGRKFYSSCGFNLLSESVHEETGNALLRLKHSSS